MRAASPDPPTAAAPRTPRGPPARRTAPARSASPARGPERPPRATLATRGASRRRTTEARSLEHLVASRALELKDEAQLHLPRRARGEAPGQLAGALLALGALRLAQLHLQA